MTRSSEWLTGLASGCDRLIHPSVDAGEARARQERLLAVLLAASFFVACAAAQVLSPHVGVALTLAMICASLACAWLGVALVAATGRDAAVATVLLVLGVPVGALILAAAGGLASPLVILALAMAGEAWWVRRTRAAAWAGAIAALAALASQARIARHLSWSAAPAAWHWFLPALYAATLFIRFSHLATAAKAVRSSETAENLAELIDAVVLRLTPSGEVVEVSDKARAMLGLQPELLLDNGLFERIHVGDRVAYLSALADVRDGAGSRQFEMKVRLPNPEGSDKGGRHAHFLVEMLATAAGVTILLRADERIAELREAFAAARDTADSDSIAKHRFLAAVSHELRTPLNAIIGFSDMMSHGMCGEFADPRQGEYVGLIRESGNHLLGLVNSILDVSRIESGAYDIEPEPFRFREALETCRAMMALQAENRRIVLNVNMGAGVGEIVADRRSVKQMLINLLSNAIKFTPEGGRVTVTASRLGSRLHFSVSDTGIGIEAGDLARLGEPFTQVQNDYTRQFEGTGLGLSLVKGLVALHRGTMTIESAPGEGTTVAISLPVEGPGTAREDSAAAEAEINEAGNGTIRKIA